MNNCVIYSKFLSNKLSYIARKRFREFLRWNNGLTTFYKFIHGMQQLCSSSCKKREVSASFHPTGKGHLLLFDNSISTVKLKLAANAPAAQLLSKRRLSESSWSFRLASLLLLFTPIAGRGTLVIRITCKLIITLPDCQQGHSAIASAASDKPVILYNGLRPLHRPRVCLATTYFK